MPFVPLHREVSNNIQLAQRIVKLWRWVMWNQQPHQPALEKPFYTFYHRSKAPASDILDLKVAFPRHNRDFFFFSICLIKNVPCDHHLDHMWCSLNYLIWPLRLPPFLKEANLLLPELNGSRCTVTNHYFPASLQTKGTVLCSANCQLSLFLEAGEWALV